MVIHSYKLPASFTWSEEVKSRLISNLCSSLKCRAGESSADAELNPDDIDLRLSANCRALSIFASYRDWEIHQVLESMFPMGALSVYFQEKTIWEMIASTPTAKQIKFSVFPQYWDDDAEPKALEVSDVERIAQVWEVDRESVERYFIPWMTLGESSDNGKAYSRDEYPVGNAFQGIDLIRALGITSPFEEGADVAYYRIY